MTSHTTDGTDLPSFTNDFFSFFTGTNDADSPDVSLTGETFLGFVTLATDTNVDGLYVSDGVQDEVTIDGASLIDATGLPEDTGGRAVVAVGFGPEDRATITGISGDQAQVFLFSETNAGPVPEQFFSPGAVIDLANAGTIVLSDVGGSSFTDQADFNNRIQFSQGGTPSFTDVPDLSEIWAQFQTDGTLPDQEIPGVFELPDPPQDGDTVSIDPITITIGGEEVTLDPGDPFWFDNLPADAREEILADPEIAVGYDYRIVNPQDGQAFATIRAPQVGDDQSYNLVVQGADGQTLDVRQIAPNQLIDVETDYAEPVTNFILEGIAPSANVDPDNPTAFPIAVSFTQTGDVDMQQTPLVRGFDFGTESTADVKGTAAAFYIGYYGRAPEPGGFAYWTSEVQTKADNGEAVFDIAENLSARFRDVAETKELYPFLDRDAGAAATDTQADAFVIDVYQNLFNRDPEEAGLDYWSDQVVDRVNAGDSIADIIITIMDGAGGEDAVTVGNKIKVAVAYGDAFTPEQFASDQASLPDINETVDDVDATDASVKNALAAIESASDSASTAVSALGVSATTEDAAFG